MRLVQKRREGAWHQNIAEVIRKCRVKTAHCRSVSSGLVVLVGSTTVVVPPRVVLPCWKVPISGAQLAGLQVAQSLESADNVGFFFRR